MTADVVPLPSPDVIELRRYRPDDDAKLILAVFREAVRRGALGHYTPAQCAAWAPLAVDHAAWAAARASHPTWVAEIRRRVVGFSDLQSTGEVDMLYVHPAFTGRGVGKALLDEVEQCARELDMPLLHARVSLTARPLFRRHGFVLVREQVVELRGERLANAVMEKLLEPVV